MWEPVLAYMCVCMHGILQYIPINTIVTEKRKGLVQAWYRTKRKLLERTKMDEKAVFLGTAGKKCVFYIRIGYYLLLVL